MRILLIVVGAVLAVLGVIFTLQGIGILGGSSMSNDTTWVIVGPIVALVGLGFLSSGLNRGRGTTA